MPLRKSRFASCAALSVAAAGALGAPVAQAAVPSLLVSQQCVQQAVSSPLARFGDAASYYLAPGGGFETGTAGWTLQGAQVVAGNETLGVVPGSRSLKMGGFSYPAVSTATTPSFCIDPSNPVFRFAVKNTTPNAVLNTYINFTAFNGQTLTVPAKSNALQLGPWTIASAQPLATSIPAVYLQSGTTATITFQASPTITGIQIDDVLVDPYRRG